MKFKVGCVPPGRDRIGRLHDRLTGRGNVESLSNWVEPAESDDNFDDNRDDSCCLHDTNYRPENGPELPVQGLCPFLAVWGSGVRIPLAPQRKTRDHTVSGFLLDGRCGGCLTTF